MPKQVVPEIDKPIIMTTVRGTVPRTVVSYARNRHFLCASVVQLLQSPPQTLTSHDDPYNSLSSSRVSCITHLIPRSRMFSFSLISDFILCPLKMSVSDMATTKNATTPTDISITNNVDDITTVYRAAP